MLNQDHSFCYYLIFWGFLPRALLFPFVLNPTNLDFSFYYGTRTCKRQGEGGGEEKGSGRDTKKVKREGEGWEGS